MGTFPHSQPVQWWVFITGWVLFSKQIRALLQWCLSLMLCWLADSSKHLKLIKWQQKTSSAPLNWLATSYRTSDCRCSSERRLRAASVQPRGSDTSRPTRVASGRPDTLWRCFSGWREPTPYSSYLGRAEKHSDRKHNPLSVCRSWRTKCVTQMLSPLIRLL